MKIKSVANLMGSLLALFGFSFFLPIAAGAYYWYKSGGGSAGLTIASLSVAISPYLIPMCVTGIVGILLRTLSFDADEPTNREAFFTVGVAWFIIALLGAVPFILSGTLVNPYSAFFESMAGFATCGASVIKEVEILPKSILMWRATTQWLGGMGIVALAVVVLSRIVGAGGTYLYKAETAGHDVVKLRPKLRETAAILWRIYALLTFLEAAVLFLLFFTRHGMPVDDSIFEAICHSFTTLATGGFSTRNASIAAFNDPFIEVVIMMFMVAGAANFMLHYKTFKGISSYFHDTEFNVFIASLSIATVFIAINLWASKMYPALLDCIRYASFNVVSIHSTTGFASADFALWPNASKFVLFVLMLMGGCIGSTAGAIKVGRIVLLLKVAHREMKKALNPRAVIPLTLGKSTIPDVVATGICVFFFIYVAIFIASTILILLFGGLDDIFVSASAVATTMGGVGPGFGAVGPMANYAGVTNAGKVILSIDMWLGRLEIYAPLMIFLPSTYRR